MRFKAAVAALVMLASAYLSQQAPYAGAAGDCASTSASRARARSGQAHAYFYDLVARPECLLAYSLRDAEQLAKYRHSRTRDAAVAYDPANDPDPRRQDAAKLIVPAGRASLPNQIRLPMSTADGTTTLITWDAWFGAEFRHERTGIATYKTFQFASPKDRIWFEVRTRFKQDKEAQARRLGKGTGEKRAAKGGGPSDPNLIGMVDARGYGARGTAPLGPNVTKSAPLAPQVGAFAIRAETWTRYWVVIDQRANDWDLISLWVADETHDPVQILDRLQFSVKGSVDAFWLEYNTSSKGRAKNALGPRVAYARNVVMLRNVKDVPALLQRPSR